MIDPCAVLDQSVSKQLGLTAAAETFGGPTACSIEMNDPSGDTSYLHPVGGHRDQADIAAIRAHRHNAGADTGARPVERRGQL